MTSLLDTCLPSDAVFAGPPLMDDINLRSLLHAALPQPTRMMLQSALKSASSLSFKRTRSSEKAVPASSPSELEALPWIRNLMAGNEYMDLQVMEELHKEESVLGPDHIFRALVRHGMVLDNKAFFRAGRPLFLPTTPSPAADELELLEQEHQGDAAAQAPSSASSQMQVLNVYKLGDDVAGHKGLVHGGLSAALMDETFGYLLYVAKESGILSFEMILTAQLNITYLKPLPTKSVITCIASVESIEGRKIWVEARLCDGPDGASTFAKARALFIIPKA